MPGRLGGAVIDRNVVTRRRRHRAPEVRQPPPHGHPQTGRARRVVLVEARQRLGQPPLRVAQVGGAAAGSRNVTISWCSGGTTTSTLLSVTTRIPPSTCCSGGRAVTAGRLGARPARSASS